MTEIHRVYTYIPPTCLCFGVGLDTTKQHNGLLECYTACVIIVVVIIIIEIVNIYNTNNVINRSRFPGTRRLLHKSRARVVRPTSVACFHRGNGIFIRTSKTYTTRDSHDDYRRRPNRYRRNLWRVLAMDVLPHASTMRLIIIVSSRVVLRNRSTYAMRFRYSKKTPRHFFFLASNNNFTRFFYFPGSIYTQQRSDDFKFRVKRILSLFFNQSFSVIHKVEMHILSFLV